MRKKSLVILFIFLLILSFAYSKEIKINKWMSLGPIPVEIPVFSKDKNSAKIDYLLNIKHFKTNNLYPSEGDLQFSIDGKNYFWKKQDEFSSNKKSSILYLFSYLKTDRFIEGKIKVKTNFPFIVFVDGKKVFENTKEGEVRDFKTSPLKLETGKHRIMIKYLLAGEIKLEADISFALSEKYNDANIKISTTPLRPISLREILDLESVNSLKINPTGNSFAVLLSERNNGKLESWIEIRGVKTGKLLNSYRFIGKLSNFKWRPDGKAFTFVKYGKNGADLILVKNGENPEKILSEEKDFSNYVWSPDGKFIVYSKVEKHKEYINGLKQLLSTEDRQRGNRNKSYLYIVYPNGGFKLRITAGEYSTNLLNIGENGKILFSISTVDYKHRPYIKNTFYCFDPNKMKTKKLFSSYWVSFIKWYDNNRLIALGAPDSFNKIGLNLKINKISNPYDVQAYFYDIKTGKVIPLTKEFKPAIDNVFVNRKKDKLYFLTTDRSYKSLYEYNIKKRTFKRLVSDIEIVSKLSIARQKDIGIFAGNNSNTPPKVYSVNLKTGKHKLLYYPAKKDYSQIRFGKVEDWNFENSDGQTIIGRIYYPPDFTSEKKYPMIIYYYGGTVPVERSFGGRYPKNYWAANGYIVYVLQPRGATGFGQDFSAYHVNGWGGKPIDDIIEGAKKFLKAHPFVNKNKVGIIGASYGGYTTEYLVTVTDMFAAAVSHAGISLLPHYWGEGYWGYTYSAGATAFSFPWNRKDIYVDKSPLFRADKIKTPLLLLHGDSDTNVPTGESDQLYTALKLLGRPVEYIKVKGQNHWIMDYKKRILWSKTIVAWFDRWLKDQPEFWYSMYKKTK